MNREQCKGIMAHIELIKHFAEGGDIGIRAPNCSGVMLAARPAKGLNLQALHADGGTYYLMVKPKYKFNTSTKAMERLPRSWPEIIRDDEIIACKQEATC